MPGEFEPALCTRALSGARNRNEVVWLLIGTEAEDRTWKWPWFIDDWIQRND